MTSMRGFWIISSMVREREQTSMKERRAASSPDDAGRLVSFQRSSGWVEGAM